MKRFLFFLLLFAGKFTNAQPFFEKIFYNQHGTACAREDSTGHIVVSFPEDTLIILFDSAMNPLWNKTYDFSTYLFEILPNGNWICGGSKSNGSVATAHMAMLDGNGDTIWTRTPLAASPAALGVANLRIDYSGNYIAFAPPTLIKMDSLGNTIITNGIPSGNNFNYNVGYENRIITAFTVWNPVGSSMLQVDAYDSTLLNHLWSNTLVDTTGNPHTYTAGIVFPGTSPNPVVGGNYDWYLNTFDFDQGGNFLNINFPFNISGQFTNVIPVSTGGYLCIGKTFSNKAFVMRSSSNTYWYVEFNGIKGVDAYFAQETRDGGFIISGSTTDSSSNKIPWMVKIDQYGSMTTRIEETKADDKFQVYYSNHRIEIEQSMGDRLVVYDMSGRVVKTIDRLPEIYSENFPGGVGIYLFSLYRDGVWVGSRKVFVDSLY